MPSFHLLGKQNNRSQHGVPEQQMSPGPGPGPGQQRPSASTSSIGLGQQGQGDGASALSSADSYQDTEPHLQQPQLNSRGMSQKLQKPAPQGQYIQQQPPPPQQLQQGPGGGPPQPPAHMFHSSSNASSDGRTGPLGPGNPESQLPGSGGGNGGAGGSRPGGPGSASDLQYESTLPPPPSQANDHSQGNYGESIPQAVGRSQSQRYSTIQQHPYQQHLPPHPEQYQASNSADNLAEYQQRPDTVTAVLPEKKSARKRFMKGIFGSSSSSKDRDSHHEAQHRQQPQQPQQPQPHLQAQQLHQQLQQNPISPPPPPSGGPRSSYEYNNSDLTPSNSNKRNNRAPGPPGIDTDQPPQPPNPAWHQQHSGGGYSPHPAGESPLQGVGEVDDYHFSGHDSDRELPPQTSRTTLNNTIRQIPGDQDSSPHDDNYYRSGAPLHQRQQSGHQQKQQQQLQQQPPPPLQIPQQQHQPQQAAAPPSATQHRQQQPQVFVQTQDQQQQQQQQQLHYDQIYDQAQSPHPFSAQPQQQHQQSFAGRKQGSFPLQTDETWIPTNHLGQQQPNPETVSQLSHESPILDPDQRSLTQASALESPAIKYSSLHSQDHSQGPHPAALQAPVPPNTNPSHHQGTSSQTQQQQSGMPAPSSGSTQSRRGQEPEKAMRGQSSDTPTGPPPGYRSGGPPMNSMPPPPQPNNQGGPPPNQGYRDGRTPQYENAPNPGDQGRASPGGSTQEAPENEKVFKDLLIKYKNVKRLFYEGKDKIEQLTGQVETLQNAVANQRMSQSRTAWDDNEYATKFNRLNGAVKDLSFNIRKDWKVIPPWLEKFVSPDALKTGKQEMTAVGRALISRWLTEELFNKCFHPGLDAAYSAQLKEIELSIRGNAYTMHSQEEYDALTAKVVNWRMATLDGLAKKLGSTSAPENRTTLTTEATKNLTAFLYQHLNEAPPGVEANTSMIVEVAVAIAANIPMESRDVCITYPLPGDRVKLTLMEVEKTALPPLGGAKDESDSDDSDDDEVEKAGNEAEKKENTANTVRFAGFVALEVRGRQVLMKAPVWTL